MTEEIQPIPPTLALIKERYQTVRELGRGGIGIVYLAHDLQLHNRPIVVKVLRDVYANEWLTKKFRQEIEALVRLDHPGIVGVFDAGQLSDGQLFVVMQFVKGITLRSLMEGPIESNRIATIMDQIGRALSVAHERGILHCDLKPENIMLQTLESGEEMVKLIDFGVAKIRDSQITSKEPTRIAGTIAYMAPEQFNGTATASSDIFALGVIAYEMVTGIKPFPAQTIFQILEAFREGLKNPPNEIRIDLPAVANDAIMKALAIDPANRYQRVRDFTDALVAGLSGVAQNAPTEEISEFTQPKKIANEKPASGMPIIILAVFLALLAFSVLGYWIYVNFHQTQHVTPTPTPIRQTVLRYSIEVQRYRDSKPYKDPYRLAKEINFEPGDKIRIYITNPAPGYFYILSEGINSGDQPALFNILFPRAKDSSHLLSTQTVLIPEKKWLEFDEEQGTEKLWLIFSENPVAEIESVKVFDNQKDKGMITDAAKSAAIESLLKNNVGAAVQRDEKNIQTVLTSKSKILVHRILLEHH